MKRTKKRQSTRQRRLFHEQLEDRRLLTSGTGWLFGVGGLDTGVTDRDCDVDDDGNIFIAGAITGSGTVDMDPGPGVMELTAPAAYVAKYAPDGSALWSAEINTTYSVIWANEAAVDAEGNVYVVGSFWEEATFGDTTLTSQGESDAFVSKLDADGNFVWTVTARAADYVKAAGVDVDSAGDVYVTGYFAGSVSFGPFEVTSNGGYDAYVAKLNSNGELLWFQEVAGMENVVGLEVAVASDNSVYASGNFYGSADFGGLPLSSAGEQDAYIAKLSVDDGSVLWTRQVGGPSGDAVTEIAVDTQNNVAATGTLRGTVEFGAIQLSALRDYEAFVFEMDPTGAVLWARATEGADGNELGSASAIGIAFDDAGESVYVTGAQAAPPTLTLGPPQPMCTNCPINPKASCGNSIPLGILRRSIGRPETETTTAIKLSSTGPVMSFGLARSVRQQHCSRMEVWPSPGQGTCLSLSYPPP